MDTFGVVRQGKSTSKDSQARRPTRQKTPKNKKSSLKSAQTLCHSEELPTQESDQRDAAYTTVPRSWIHTPSEAAAQRLVDILFVQVGATVSTQALGPKAPPSQQPQFPPSRNTQPFNTMQGWLEAPIRSQPFNNIEAFAIPEMKDKDLSREAGDEDYTIEEWSVAYYDLRE